MMSMATMPPRDTTGRPMPRHRFLALAVCLLVAGAVNAQCRIGSGPDFGDGIPYCSEPVSYTHLDVYKRQDMDNWQATIVAYDSYIDQLNKYQQRLASRALRGKQPDVVTAAVQGVLLHEALEARKNDD